MRTNLNLKTSELESQVKFHLSKQVDFYLIPTWLDDTLIGSGCNETVLCNQEKINSILTAEDIKFYNENVAKIYELKSMLPFTRDMYFQYLMDTRKYPNGFPIEACNNKPSFENSISKKEVLAPFVRNSDDIAPTDFWHVVARYNIHKLVDRYMVSIRFELCNPGCHFAEQAKEDEKLAEFFIGEFGVQQFANTELFKKILTV